MGWQSRTRRSDFSLFQPPSRNEVTALFTLSRPPPHPGRLLWGPAGEEGERRRKGQGRRKGEGKEDGGGEQGGKRGGEGEARGGRPEDQHRSARLGHLRAPLPSPAVPRGAAPMPRAAGRALGGEAGRSFLGLQSEQFNSCSWRGAETWGRASGGPGGGVGRAAPTPSRNHAPRAGASARAKACGEGAVGRREDCPGWGRGDRGARSSGRTVTRGLGLWGLPTSMGPDPVPEAPCVLLRPCISP